MVSHLKVGLLLTTVSTTKDESTIQKTSQGQACPDDAYSFFFSLMEIFQTFLYLFMSCSMTKAPGTNSKHTV